MKIHLFIILIIITTSCASYVSGNTTKITFKSQPVGAEIKLNGDVIGKTPMTVELNNKVTGSISIEKQGYKPSHIPLKKSLNGWILGNLVPGGLLGFATDFVGGAAYDIDNDKDITIILTKL